MRARRGPSLSRFGAMYASRFLALTYAVDHPKRAPRGLRGVLASGDSGRDVRVLQQDLVEHGYMASADVNGSYDYATEQAVVAVQGVNGIERDGIASAAVRALAAGGAAAEGRARRPGARRGQPRSPGAPARAQGRGRRARHPRLHRRGRQDAGRQLRRLLEVDLQLVAPVQDVAAVRLVLHGRLCAARVLERARTTPPRTAACACPPARRSACSRTPRWACPCSSRSSQLRKRSSTRAGCRSQPAAGLAAADA